MSDYNRDTLASRVVLILVTAGFIVLSVFGIGKVLTYYETGTEPGDALNMNYKTLLQHTPKVKWLTPHTRVTENLEVNKFLLDEISSSYLNAWYLMNLSIKNGEAISLKDYFSIEPRQLLASVVSTMDKTIEIQRVDLSHDLRINWMAPDLQICGFDDYNVPLIKRMIDPASGEILDEEYLEMDFSVVMTLEDGRWRIRHLVAEEIREVESFLVNNPIKPERLPEIDQIKGVNYYPSATPWHDFWSHFNDTIISRDFGIIDSLGFNSVRVFIPFEEFGKGHVSIGLVDKLVLLLNIAEKQNLQVIVTLFDFLYDYDLQNYSAIDRHLEILSEAISDHPALLAWDIKNEPDLDFVHYGREKVEKWINFVLSRLRTYDPDSYITIGWLDPLVAPLFHSQVDFVSFHYYDDPIHFNDKINLLRDLVGDKSIMIEEFGMPTYNLLIKRKTQKDQAQYYETLMSQMDTMQDVSFMLWTLYDFEDIPNQVIGPLPWKKIPQKGFGLIKTDQSSKLALSVVQKYLD